MGETFHGVLAFAFMVALTLAGVALRAWLPFLQASLLPASLIGGLIGFALLSTGMAGNLASADFVPFAFHFFTLSFMSLVLTGRGGGAAPPAEGPQRPQLALLPQPRVRPGMPAGGLWLGVGWTMSLALQALVGLAVILVYNAVTGGELSRYLGLIATHGFTQGPGQALALGSIWQESFAVEHAVSFGLIYASLGFIISFAVGVPAARFAIARGLNANLSARLTKEFLRGLHDRAARPEAGRQVTHSANVDSLVYHLGILGCAYLLTDLYLTSAHALIGDASLLGIPVGHLFSHNLFFVHGLVVCLIIRGLMDAAGFGHLIDDETQKRITGSSVDLMMAASIMAVEFSLLSEYLAPIALVSLAVAVVTGALCFGFARWLSSYPPERAITLFGCCTGSTGSGLLLLRIMDPDLSTPVARELAFFNIAIIFLSMHILMVMAPVLPSYSMLTICAIYGTTFIAGIAAWRYLAPRT